MSDYKHHLEPSISKNGSLSLPALGDDTAVRLTRTESGTLYIELASPGDMMVASLPEGDALKLAEQLQQIAQSRHGTRLTAEADRTPRRRYRIDMHNNVDRYAADDVTVANDGSLIVTFDGAAIAVYSPGTWDKATCVSDTP